MSNDVLSVWLHGAEFGDLEKLRNGRMRLRVAPEAVRRYGRGSHPLSLSLPISGKRVEGPELERFLDGLLPESPVRGSLERTHGISPGDTFALLKVIGQECAGAVQFTPQGQAPGAGYLRELSKEDADRIVRDLPTLDPPDGLAVEASLGGVQAKVLLTRTEHGWAWPADGAMSTHIIKPEPVTDVVVGRLIEYEEWTMRMAAAAGLDAPAVTLADFDGRLAIIVERYDRTAGRRTHQEDFTQALAIAARDKYESTTQPPTRLQQIATRAAAESVDPDGFRRDLLRQVTFNTVIGNGDAHSKNYSMLIDRSGAFSMAPTYDAAPVFLLNSRLAHSGHVLAGQTNLRHISAAHLLDSAVAWGIDPTEARETVAGLCEAVADAAPDVALDDELAGIRQQVSARAEAFAHEVRHPAATRARDARAVRHPDHSRPGTRDGQP